MQWDATTYAGFSETRPWLPLAEDYLSVNVAAQREDPNSMLSLTHRLLELREAHPALSVGGYESVEAPEGVYAYLREGRGERFLVALNFTGADGVVEMPGRARGKVTLSTRMDREGDAVAGELQLRPHEGLLVRLA
jgi:alpha-glucosidase